MANCEAFVDESFQDPSPTQSRDGYYQLAAVVVESSGIEVLRKAVQALAVNGDFKAAHLNRDNRRPDIEAMLDAICANDDCFNLIVVRHGHLADQEGARQACLERLLLELHTQGVTHVVMDSREAIRGPDPQARNKKDAATHSRLIRAKKLSVMRLTHQHDSAENLLWVPDAVGWSHRRHVINADSQMWNKVEALTRVIHIPVD